MTDGSGPRPQPPGGSYVAKRRAAREWGQEKGRLYRQYMKTSVSGLEVGVAIGVGAALGFWADKEFGTKPIGVMVGLLLGLAHSVKLLVTMARKAMLEGEAEDAAAALDLDEEADRAGDAGGQDGTEDDRRATTRR